MEEVAADETKKALAKRLANLNRLTAMLGQQVSQLWADAFEFLHDANKRPGRRTPRRERLMRAAVLTAAAGFEACTNFLADRVAEAGAAGGNQLMESQVDCLRERHRVLENGKMKETRKKYSSKDRFLLLFDILSGGQLLHPPARAQLNTSFETRDQLVHPKPGIHLDLMAQNVGFNAFSGFLVAEILLAEAWRASKGYAVDE